MDPKDLSEITRVIVDDHAEDVGRWLAELPFSSPLYIVLDKYQSSMFYVLREIKEYIQDGKLPNG
jgi:hypothetical protein